MANLAGKRVAVSGAGIGGTAFALALEQMCKARGIKPLPAISIYERDPSPSTRESLGYSFSVMEGLPVLRNLGRNLMAELEKLEEPSSAANMCRADFRPYISVSPHKEGQAEKSYDVLRIARTRLRQTLLGKVPQELVHYGKMCVSAQPAPKEGQPVTVKFADGSSTECDLLVVADGASSKLRTALLPDEVNQYAGVTMLFGRTGPLDRLPSEVERGINLCFGKGSTSLFMGTVEKHTVVWSVTSKVPQSRAAELNKIFSNADAAEVNLLALLSSALSIQDFLQNEVPRLAEGFSGPLSAVFSRTPASSLTAIPAIYKLPHAMEQNGIAYLGDAWHPMSPFAGAGANMALMDAWELADELVNGGHATLQAAISQYAQKAAPRSKDAIQKSRINIAMAHAEGWRKQLVFLILRTVGSAIRIVNSLQSRGLWPSRKMTQN